MPRTHRRLRPDDLSRVEVDPPKTLPSTHCPRCQSTATVLAYELANEQRWSECHMCQVCLHVWDVDKMPGLTRN